MQMLPKLILLGFVSLLAACQQIAKNKVNVTDNYVRVTSENVSVLIGKKLSLNGNSIFLSEDGTFLGTWDGAPVAGSWDMRGGFWCRVLTEFKDESRLGLKECQLWEMDENSMRATINKGKACSFIYSIE